MLSFSRTNEKNRTRRSEVLSIKHILKKAEFISKEADQIPIRDEDQANKKTVEDHFQSQELGEIF